MRKSALPLTIFFCVGSLALFAQEIPAPSESPAATVVETPAPTPSAPPTHAVAKPDAVKLYRSQHYEEAVKVCLAEIKQTPGNRDSYVVLSWSLIALGRFDEAFDYARQGIERTGADSRLIANVEEALSKHYTALFAAGNYNEALTRIKRLVVYLPNSDKVPSAYALMGEIYLRKGYYVYADIAFSVALNANPNIFEWWVGAGTAREKDGDYKSALSAFTEALKLNPDSQEALRGRDRVRQQLTP
ncbi:MAG TPA: tetratricopeptide repeat protein [Spirochaetia bacterium]|nr:tetratricopeptide repeat protein [Spirochaetia bacterium]